MEAVQWDPRRIQIGAAISSDSPITSLDYHKHGQVLVMATKDAYLHLVDSIHGYEKKKIAMKTHGIGE